MSPAGFPDLPSGWSWHELGTLCINIDDGDWIETKDQGGSDYRLLQVSNIGVGTFRETNKFRFISQSTFDRIRCTEIQPNHVLVSRMPDPIGRAWCVEVLAHRAVTAVDVAIVETDPSRLLPKYCAYYLNSPLNLRYAGSRASGTTRLRITRRDLSGFPIPVPEIKVQDRIVGLLSAYDELIENNTRRIEILEEMAQAIYREWFVEFRYPGHEDDPLVDSELGPIPKGWTVRRLGECVAAEKGLSYKGEFLTDEGTPMANLKCFDRTGGFRRSGSKPYSGPFKVQHSIVPGDLIVANTDLTQAGTVIGSPALVPHRGFEEGGLISHHLFAVRFSASSVDKHYLYRALQNERFRSYARGCASGTTVLGFRASDFLSFPLVVPDLEVQAAFSSIVSDLYSLSERLSELSENLSETRDLLLPKLISGEIDVSELDIELAGSSV